MAGTALNYNEKVACGVIAQLWVDLAVPAAGSQLTLDVNGTPDSTANPNAKHLGYTDAGITVRASFTEQEFFADEIATPICSSTDEADITLSGSLLQVRDQEVLKFLSAGVGTPFTGTGVEGVTLGLAPVTYSSVAVIWQSPNTPGKFEVFQLYKARNTNGFEMQFGRKNRSASPFTIKGYGVANRSLVDSVGSYWRQTAA